MKTIALMLASLLLLQGYVVYHKTPTTIENASKEKAKTRV
jgi:hypothetical protein